MSPYQTLVLVVAPTFLGPDEPEVMVLERDDAQEADHAVAI